MTTKKSKTKKTRAKPYPIQDFMKAWKANEKADTFAMFAAAINKDAGRTEANAFSEALIINKIELVKKALRGSGIKPPSYPKSKTKKEPLTSSTVAKVVKAAMVQGWFENE